MPHARETFLTPLSARASIDDGGDESTNEEPSASETYWGGEGEFTSSHPIWQIAREKKLQSDGEKKRAEEAKPPHVVSHTRD